MVSVLIIVVLEIVFSVLIQGDGGSVRVVIKMVVVISSSDSVSSLVCFSLVSFFICLSI